MMDFFGSGEILESIQRIPTWTITPLCEHCYCQPTDYVGSAEHPRKHVQCCHCENKLESSFALEYVQRYRSKQ